MLDLVEVERWLPLGDNVGLDGLQHDTIGLLPEGEREVRSPSLGQACLTVGCESAIRWSDGQRVVSRHCLQLELLTKEYRQRTTHG